MLEKYYLDSCIWKDYFENRSDRFRPLGDWALELIKKIIKEEGLFIFSDHLIKELEKQYSHEVLDNFFEIIPIQSIIKVETTEQQAKEAFQIKNKLKIPYGDVLHAIIARDNDAILVTRDKHFYELAQKINVKKPEDLL